MTTEPQPLSMRLDNEGRINIKRDKSEQPVGYVLLNGPFIPQAAAHLRLIVGRAGYWVNQARPNSKHGPKYNWSEHGWLVPQAGAEATARLAAKINAANLTFRDNIEEWCKAHADDVVVILPKAVVDRLGAAPVEKIIALIEASDPTGR